MDHEARKRYRQHLLKSEFATLFAEAGATKSAAASSSAVVEEEETPELVAPIEGATRYLSLDPALSCGWAILQVKDGALVSVDVGVIDV
eukprot:4542337-Prymnesium_polylepis.1